MSIHIVKRTYTDYATSLAKDDVPGRNPINKFGEATDCDSGVPTDVWDGADAAGTGTKIWTQPQLTPQTFDVVSASANDAAAGTGMRTLRVYGLKTWDSVEESEVVILNGTTPVATSSTWVIIYRVEGLTWGSGKAAVGLITVTGTDDSVVTAAIQIGEEQSLMAIFAVGSVSQMQIKKITADVLKTTGGTVEVTGTLKVKLNADVANSAWQTKERFNLSEIEAHDQNYDGIHKTFAGPCIAKIQVLTDTGNASCTAEIDAVAVRN